MSLLPLLTTIPPSSSTHSLSLLHHHSPTQNNPISLAHKQSKEPKNRHTPTSRRTSLLSLIALTSFPALQVPPAIAAPSQTQVLPEFGPHPRPLTSIIRVKVPRPKKSEKGGATVEVLSVEDIEVPNNDPVRFDVYVDKPDQMTGPRLGEFAGSLVDLARSGGFSKSRKMALTLGITGLVEEIGGKDAESLVVSLVPRTGVLSVGGVHIEFLKAE